MIECCSWSKAILDEAVKSWLKIILHNRVSFRKRMRRLIFPFKANFGNSRDRERFISRFNDTRNYLTHYDEQSTSLRAKTSDELVMLHGKMEGLFQLHILKLLGFDEEAINSIVSNSWALSNKLSEEIS